MMQLYYHPMSAASRAVRLLLGEYKLETQILLEQEWMRRPDFLALNPGGFLPVLVTQEDIPLCGAEVIFEYLEESCGALSLQQSFFPDTALERAEVRRLIYWFLHKFDNEITRQITRERVYKQDMPVERGGGSPDSAILRLARSNIKPHMRYIEWLLEKREWISGHQLYYADFAAAAHLSILDYLKEIDWDSYVTAREWYRRLKSRASFRPLLADKLSTLAPSSHYTDLDF